MLVTKRFRITFDEPNEDWLCADNLAVALHAYCKGTKFLVEQLGKTEELNGSGNPVKEPTP